MGCCGFIIVHELDKQCWEVVELTEAVGALFVYRVHCQETCIVTGLFDRTFDKLLGCVKHIPHTGHLTHIPMVNITVK